MLYGDKENGFSVRLVNASTSLSEGETGTYNGNDGKVYSTKVINGIEWLTDNLEETKYSDGTTIPYEGVNPGYYTNEEWANLIDDPLRKDGMCYYGV